MWKRRMAIAIMVGLISVSLVSVGCKKTVTQKSTGAVSKAKNTTVEIKDFEFKPDKVTIMAKTRITWVNKDAGQHTVVGKGFDSGVIYQGDSYSYDFILPGTYTYHCRLHPYMEGTVIVKG